MPKHIESIEECVRSGLYKHYKNYKLFKRIFTGEEVSMSDSYSNLALVEKPHLTQQELTLDSSRLVNQAVQGEPDIKSSHERLYTVPEPIAPEQLFKWSYKEKKTTPKPTKILVTGLPGSGKTTFFEYCVHEWQAGRLWPHFKAVFLFKLCTVAEWVSRRKESPKIAHLIREQCLGGVDLDKPSIEELNQFLRHNKDQIAFLCDGYDEILGEQLHELSGLNQLLQDISQYTYVVVSSRPRGFTVIEPHHRVAFDRHLENVGLTDENIKVHVTRRFQDAAQAEACLRFLRQNPSIWGACHNIIHLELFLFLQTHGYLHVADHTVWTLSRLYREMLARLVEYNMRKHPSLAKCIQPRGANDITIALRFLEYLAHAGMRENQLVFHRDALRPALDAALRDYHIEPNHASCHVYYQRILQAAMESGLLKAIQSSGALLSDKKHYFAHLSFQEFMAACCAKRQLSQLNTLASDAQLNQIIHHKYVPRLQLTWWFTVGSLYQDWKLAPEERKNTCLAALLRFYRGLLAEPRDITGRRHLPLLAHCLDECEADDSIPLLKALLAQQARWFGHQRSGNLAQCPQVIGSQEIVGCLLSHVLSNDYTKRCRAKDTLSSLPNLPSAVENFLLEAMRDKTQVYCAINILDSLSNPSRAVVDVLLATATQVEDSEVRTAAVAALKRLSISSKAVVSTLLTAARAKDSSVRWVAVTALGQLSYPYFLPLRKLSSALVNTLLAAARNKDSSIRCAAVTALGRSSNPSKAVVDALLTAAAQDKDSKVRWAAANTRVCLSNPSKAVVDTLLAKARDENGRIHFTILEILQCLSNPPSEVVDIFLTAAQDKNCEMRWQAAWALVGLSNPSSAAVDALLALALRDNIWARLEVAKALQRSSNPADAVMDALLAAAARGNEDSGIRCAAVETVGWLLEPSSAVVCSLRTAVARGDSSVRCAALTALDRLSNPPKAVVDVLLTAAAPGEDSSLRCIAVKALGHSSNPSKAVVDVLLTAAARGEANSLRCAAVTALGRSSNPPKAVVDVLLTAAAQDEVNSLRCAAVKALDRSSNPSSAVVDIFLIAMQDKDLDIRLGATYALSNLSNPSSAVVSALLVAARVVDSNIRRAAVEALSRLSNPSSAVVDIFLIAVQDENLYIRLTAVKALGCLSNPSSAVVNALLAAAARDKDWEKPNKTFIEALGLPDRLLAFDKFALTHTSILKQLLCTNSPQSESPLRFPFHRHFVAWCYEQDSISLILDRQTAVLHYETTVRTIDLPKKAMQALYTELKTQAQSRDLPLDLFNLSGYESSSAELAILQSDRPSPFIVSNTMWTVHLVRKKGDQHVFLVIESLENEEHLARRYELIQVSRDTTRSVRLFDSSSGVATIQEREDFLDSLKRHKSEYVCRSWEITAAAGHELLGQLQTQVGSRLRYAVSGGSTFSGNRAYNCVTWAEEQLRNHGYNPGGHWFDFMVVLPSNHIPARPSNQGACLVM